jgi:ribose/xylose/arabinose/galactoside ABC-type transport system permease subunit
MALGVVCGSINGYLIGYLRLRAFLTTLVTLIIFRSIYDIVFLRTSTAIVSSLSGSALWTFIGENIAERWVFGLSDDHYRSNRRRFLLDNRSGDHCPLLPTS